MPPTRSSAKNLFEACNNGDIRSVKRILAGRHKWKSINQRDNHNYTPLHIAVRYAPRNSVECVKLLISNPECDVRAKTFEGETPLFLACMQKTINLEIVRALLRKDASLVEHGNNEEMTPLHVVTQADRLDVVQTLLEFGANVDKADLDGDTALHLAAYFSLPHIVEFLLYGTNCDSSATNDEHLHAFWVGCKGESTPKSGLETLALIAPFMEVKEFVCLDRKMFLSIPPTIRALVADIFFLNDNNHKRHFANNCRVKPFQEFNYCEFWLFSCMHDSARDVIESEDVQAPFNHFSLLIPFFVELYDFHRSGDALLEILVEYYQLGVGCSGPIYLTVSDPMIINCLELKKHRTLFRVIEIMRKFEIIYLFPAVVVIEHCITPMDAMKDPGVNEVIHFLDNVLTNTSFSLRERPGELIINIGNSYQDCGVDCKDLVPGLKVLCRSVVRQLISNRYPYNISKWYNAFVELRLPIGLEKYLLFESP